MGKIPRVLEKSVVKKIRAFLDEQDDLYYFVKEAKSLRGLPDLIICKRGVFIALEVKRSASEIDSKRSKLQKYHIDRINKAGGYAFFIFPENMESVLSIVSKLCL